MRHDIYCFYRITLILSVRRSAEHFEAADKLDVWDFLQTLVYIGGVKFPARKANLYRRTIRSMD